MALILWSEGQPTKFAVRVNLPSSLKYNWHVCHKIFCTHFNTSRNKGNCVCFMFATIGWKMPYSARWDREIRHKSVSLSREFQWIESVASNQPTVVWIEMWCVCVSKIKPSFCVNLKFAFDKRKVSLFLEKYDWKYWCDNDQLFFFNVICLNVKVCTDSWVPASSVSFGSIPIPFYSLDLKCNTKSWIWYWKLKSAQWHSEWPSGFATIRLCWNFFARRHRTTFLRETEN